MEIRGQNTKFPALDCGCGVFAERGDQPAAVSHLHPVLRALPHPQADGDQEEADLALR